MSKAYRTALTTVCIGDKYRNTWERFSRKSWELYAEKHDYSLVVIDEPIDRSDRGTARSPAWQKCLVLEHPALREYERVVWIDADIVINTTTAPDILYGIPSEKIGAVISGAYLHEDLKVPFLERLRGRSYPPHQDSRVWSEDQRFWQHGLQHPTHEIVQTGVLVLSPSHHAPLLRQVYDGQYPVDLPGYEQMPLSSAILVNDLLQHLNSRFNAVIYEILFADYPYLLSSSVPNKQYLLAMAVAAVYVNAFFAHFAYQQDLVESLAMAANLWGSDRFPTELGLFQEKGAMACA